MGTPATPDRPQPFRLCLRGVCIGVAAATLVLLAPASTLAPALAQNGAAQQRTPEELLTDFIFYVNTANPELAAANARALLQSGIEPGELVGLVEEDPTLLERFDQAYRRALRFDQVEDVAGELWALYEQGRRDRARNPGEISRNIELLKGTARQRILGRQRLIEAGEYAVPQLLDVIIDARDRQLLAEVQSLLLEMGRSAVKPLSAAITGVQPEVQERLAVILGGVGYEIAIPALREVAEGAEGDRVREEAERAIRRIGGELAQLDSVAAMYRELADDFAAEPASLLSFPDETHQLLWEYDSEFGLFPVAIRTPVYHEAEAMRLAERSLLIDENEAGSVPIWLHANFSRQIDTPEDYENPVYGPDRREAMYYAVISGSAPVQRVLARAMDDRETRIARLAIEALSRSAGGAGLWRGLAADRPLVDALAYPDRRVRYEAAMALGSAAPTVNFQGAERVVPTLAGIVRDAGSRFAVVISRSEERQQEIRSALEELGFTVLAPASSLVDAAPQIAEAPGVDLIVSDLDGEAGESLVSTARSGTSLRATPIFALVPFSDQPRLELRYRDDELTRVGRDGISSDELKRAVESLVADTAGPSLTAEEAEAYALEALEVLETLAVADSEALSVQDAAPTLIAAIDRADGAVKRRVARVLAHVGERRSQVAITDAALDAEGEQRLALLAIATDSVKRFGNLLEPRQIDRLIELSEMGDDAEATAAAALLGALGLPNERIVPLILGG